MVTDFVALPMQGGFFQFAMLFCQRVDYKRILENVSPWAVILLAENFAGLIILNHVNIAI